MTGDWLVQTPALLTALVIVLAPGLVATFAVGLRGLALLAFAPVFGVTSTAVLALLFGAIGVPWSPLSWAGGTVGLIVAAVLIGAMLGNRLPQRPREQYRWLVPAALAVGMLLLVWRLIAYIQDPSGISQTNDDVFHLNAVRHIIDTADASSMHVNAVIGGRSFYPAAWHGIVSLIVMISGCTIPVAANMLTLVIGAMIWPAGIAWLTRTVTGSAATVAYAAILAGALQAFPLLMFQWGVLFPNALSTALIPAGIALVVSLPGVHGDKGRVRDVIRGILLVLVAAGALLISQPAAFLPWAAISVFWLTFHLFRADVRLGRGWKITVLVIAWAALIAAWLYLAQGTSGSHWPPFRGRFEALLDVLLNGQVRMPFAIGLSVLMVIGLVTAVRRPALRWFSVAWLGISVLYFLVATVGRSIIRVDILGAWYADPYRIAALAPLVVIPLAAIGADVLVRAAARFLRRDADAPSWVVTGPIIASILMIVLVALRPTAMPDFLKGSFDRESRYLTTDDSYLSTSERALLEDLDGLIEPGARVIANPSTGAGFGYFFSGVDVYPRTWAPPSSGPWAVLADDLRDAAEDPAVCAALEAYGSPEYVLDFGPGEDAPGRYRMDGMTGFAGQRGFEYVAGEGDATLWRITACAR